MYDDLLELSRSTKYPIDGFIFVQRGLDFTVKGIHGEVEEPDPTVSRHVNGQQLCTGLKEYAIEQYGLMARTVLRSWNINSCDDFGHIVFAMVEADMMQQTDKDTLDDFVGVYDFADAFAPRLQLNH